jgi:AAA+ ATPase superfamily predicted ATPase
LKVLIDLKIVERIYPYGSNSLKNKNGQYMIVENFFRFWYRFVFANRGAIEGGQGEVIAEGAFNYLSNFIGEPAFEIICRQYLNRLNEHKKLPFVAGAYEKWWGKDKLTGDSNDIDIVVSSAFDDSILLGECKWKSQLKQVKEINKLLQKDRLILGKTSYYHYFFSKIHYSKEAQKIAEKNKFLTLVTLDDLFFF